MTCGIYSLHFGDNHFYIGKSINIEERFLQHMKKLNTGSAAKAMQSCFEDHGAPSQSIVLQCHPDHLDVLEPLYINMHYNSAYCLNSDRPTIHHKADLTIDNEKYKILQMSTIEHMEEIIKLRTNLLMEKHSNRIASNELKNTKNRELEELLKLPEIAKAVEVRDMFNIQAMEINRLNTELSLAKGITNKIAYDLEKEKKKSWWDKLWE